MGKWQDYCLRLNLIRVESLSPCHLFPQDQGLFAPRASPWGPRVPGVPDVAFHLAAAVLKAVAANLSDGPADDEYLAQIPLAEFTGFYSAPL